MTRILPHLYIKWGKLLLHNKNDPKSSWVDSKLDFSLYDSDHFLEFVQFLPPFAANKRQFLDANPVVKDNFIKQTNRKNVNLVQFMAMLIIDYEVRQIFTDFVDFLRRKCVTQSL